MGKDTAVVINVDLDKKCRRCGKGGATENGVCLACIAKAVKRGEFDHILKKTKGGHHARARGR